MAMKNFLLYVFKILVLALLVIFIMDKAYSYAFLRANNHFVTQKFTDKGLKTFNFGM